VFYQGVDSAVQQNTSLTYDIKSYTVIYMLNSLNVPELPEQEVHPGTFPFRRTLPGASTKYILLVAHSSVLRLARPY